MNFVVRIASLSIVFIVLIVFRKRLARLLRKLPLPEILTYVIISIPLIIMEEQINCQANWCGKVLIPPTLPYLVVELLIVYGICKWLRVKKILIPVIAYSVFGILWELTVGGLKGAALPFPILLFFIVWVGISYAFVSMTPLSLLEK